MSEATPTATDRRMATGYAVLARCWREPDAALVEAIESGDLDGVLAGVESVSLDDLRAEHARLFVGPAEPPCPPYESVYRDDDGHVLGPTTRAVVTWYRTYGMGLDPGASDLPDHVAAELEFLAHLTRQGESAAVEQFLDEHPRQWFGSFLTAVRESTREPFYVALADATDRAIESGL